MSFDRLVYRGKSHGYYSSCKLKNNQTATIFFLEDYSNRDVTYCIAFAISSKRKNIKEWISGERDVLTNKQTGKSGVEGLLWAKKQIGGFEEFIVKKKHTGKVIMQVGWTDNRRRNIYERYLGRIGYKIGYRWGCKCLYKQLYLSS